MYTVVRFHAPTERSVDLVAIGESLNLLASGTFQGLRRAGDGFTCVVSSSSRWSEHRTALRAFLSRFSTQIQATVGLAGQVVIDVAIEPGDRRDMPVVSVHVDPEFLLELARAGVGFEVSTYG